MSSLLKITTENEDKTFYCNKKQAIKLELFLNDSPYAYMWADIGDQLFQYGTEGTPYIIFVNTYQYEYLYKVFCQH